MCKVVRGAGDKVKVSSRKGWARRWVERSGTCDCEKGGVAGDGGLVKKGLGMAVQWGGRKGGRGGLSGIRYGRGRGRRRRASGRREGRAAGGRVFSWRSCELGTAARVGSLGAGYVSMYGFVRRFGRAGGGVPHAQWGPVPDARYAGKYRDIPALQSVMSPGACYAVRWPQEINRKLAPGQAGIAEATRELEKAIGVVFGAY